MNALTPRVRTGIRIVKQVMLAAVSLACAWQFLWMPLDVLALDGSWKRLLVDSPIGIIFVWPVLCLIYIFIRSRHGRSFYLSILLVHTVTILWWLVAGGLVDIRETFQQVYYGIAYYCVASLCAWLALYYESRLYRRTLPESCEGGGRALRDERPM